MEPTAADWVFVAEQMSEALLIIKADGSIAAANSHFTEWFGLPHGADEIGQKIDALHKSFATCFTEGKIFEEKWQRLTSAKTSGTTEIWEINHPAHRYLELRIVPLPDHAGTVFFWRDKTEKHSLQDALHRAQRMESLGRLSGGIAHDINNLLTAISGNLSLAQQHLETGFPAEARNLLATASKVALGGRDLVKQLLTHARKKVESVQSFDLSDLITDVRGLLKHSISPLVLVEVQLPKSLWNVTADRNSIQQVVIILCVNAVDAMKGRANSRLTLTAANSPRAISRPAGRGQAGTDYVCLQVRDNGCGIPPEVLQNIFEPFYTTKAQGEGTGLGLSISHDIVAKFGGWIECESQPGAGTTFSVYLPRGEKVAVEKKPAPVPFAKRFPSTSNAERILVVDDDALVRAVSARLLSGVGYKVFTAIDGVEALEWLRTPGNAADLILLDVSMPRLSGHDTMHEIRQLCPGVPIVMCSGSLTLCDPDAPQEGDPTAPPPDGRISKPYDVIELTRMVRSVLDNRPAAAEVCVA
ncbi:MAG: response regulator [Verrucomicrobia bacterium]|nr:response regulator [Verrucomicrobiota bacterium]